MPVTVRLGRVNHRRPSALDLDGTSSASPLSMDGLLVSGLSFALKDTCTSSPSTLIMDGINGLGSLNMLLNDPSATDKSIIEVSSGSTVTSLAVSARVLYDNTDTTAFVSNKASVDRIREMQFFGLKVALYGGPTYTETTDPRGPVVWARRLGRENSKMVNLGQYDNEHN
ncbi:MAG: hypothetical protein Q9166_004324 [cf. Caloplaca sp. 2 TL-2023]